MPLSDAYKQSLIDAYVKDKRPCFRCGDNFESTKKCSTKSGKSWKDLTTEAERREAEELYKSLKPPETPQASSQGPVEGKAKPNPDLGKIEMAYRDLIDDTRKRKSRPAALPENGVCSPNDTAQIGSDPQSDDEVTVISNYVRINKIPQKLHVYSLSFWRPSKDPKKKNTRVEYNKRKDIEGCYRAMLASDVLDLKSAQDGKIQVATNFKDLWTNLPIADHQLDEHWESGPFAYTQANGEVIQDMYVDVVYHHALEDVDEDMETGDLTSLSDHIRALNAHVAESIRNYTSITGTAITQVGANKFFMDRGYEPMTGLRAVRGYYTSIRPSDAGTLLNVNTATSAFLKPTLVSELLAVQGRDYVERLLRGKTVRIIYQRSEFEGSNAKPNKKEARLKNFVQFGELAKDQLFFKLQKQEDGKLRTVEPKDPGRTVWDYFTKTFPAGSGVRTALDAAAASSANRTTALLCVNVGKRVKTFSTAHGRGFSKETPSANSSLMQQQSEKGALWIPACLLEIVPNQVISSTLGTEHTTEMLDSAVHLPARSHGLITREGFEILGLLNPQKDSSLEKRDFEIGNKLITFAARTLPQPKVYYDSSTGPQSKAISLASWNLVEDGPGNSKPPVTFINPKGEGKLSLIGVPYCLDKPTAKQQGKGQDLPDIPESPRTSEEELIRKHTRLHDQLKSHGLDNLQAGSAGPPPMPQGLEQMLDFCYKNKETGPNDCFVVVLRQKQLDTYSIIKRKADLEHGKHTVCAIGHKLMEEEKKLASYASNLALKINMKYGGEDHHLEAEKLSELFGASDIDETIVLGADVAHPGAGGKLGSPSIACVVGSVDSHFMTYPGSMRLQAGGQERIKSEHMRSMVRERLCAWMQKQSTDSPPSRILFYRDGISESQYDECIRNEIRQVQLAYDDLKGPEDKDLMLTFVIVGKRHHTRFFATRVADSHQGILKNVKYWSGNLKPGLLVDSVVTSLGPSNFYLQSHTAIKGTARSGHYVVLQDGMNLYQDKAGHLPQITHMLCYAFGRATKGVSYVAPAYIADRLCQRGVAYLRPWNNDHEQEPVFRNTKDDQGRPLDKDRLRDEKNRVAMELARDGGVWGTNFNDIDAHRPMRLNPWHPNLDQGMFWM